VNIAYLSDVPIFGLIPENVVNLRADVSWAKTLGLFSVPLDSVFDNIDFLNSFDVVIINYPKDDEQMLQYCSQVFDVLTCKKGFIQHGGHDHFMNWSCKTQLLFINLLKRSDFFVYTNAEDLHKFQLLAPKTRMVFLPTDLDAQVVTLLDTRDRQDAVMLSGNMTPWYAGTYSLLVAEKFGLPITIPEMGRRQKDEKEFVRQFVSVPVKHLTYLQWNDWFVELSKHKYAVNMMPVAACGSFTVACAALGIPCIGRKHLTAQAKCFPDLCVDESFAGIDEKVKYAQEHYDEISRYAKEQFKKYFERQVVAEFVLKQFESLR